MTDIISVSKSDFKNEVLESRLPVLIDFWAVWCAPCRMFSPVVEAIAEKYGDKLKVVKINTDDEPELAEEFDIMSIPTLALIRNGEVVDVSMGAVPQHLVEEWLTANEVI